MFPSILSERSSVGSSVGPFQLTLSYRTITRCAFGTWPAVIPFQWRLKTVVIWAWKSLIVKNAVNLSPLLMLTTPRNSPCAFFVDSNTHHEFHQEVKICPAECGKSFSIAHADIPSQFSTCVFCRLQHSSRSKDMSR